MAFDLKDYVDVATRIAEFRAKHPEGSLQPANLEEPFKIVGNDSTKFVVYVAAAYRSPDDPRPGIGVAWEPFPGRTPYTKDSEVMNAETSAWGRAIVAALAADTRLGVASADEVAARTGGSGKTSAPETSGAAQATPPVRLATEKQRKFIGLLVDKTGMIPEEWPLKDALSAQEASELIDWLNSQPQEPRAERRSTMRQPEEPPAPEYREDDDERPF